MRIRLDKKDKRLQGYNDALAVVFTPWMPGGRLAHPALRAGSSGIGCGGPRVLDEVVEFDRDADGDVVMSTPEVEMDMDGDVVMSTD